MNFNYKIPDTLNADIDKYYLQKMIFLYNAIEDGWEIKKINEKYIFIKNLEEKKEVYLDEYIEKFIKGNIIIKN